MPELIYLSTDKLGSFQLRLPQPWWKRLMPSRGVAVKTPIVEVAVESAAARGEAQLPEIDDVLDELRRAGREPRPFTGPGLQPGQWTRFVARFNLHVAREEVLRPAVFFLQSGRVSDDNGAKVRLMLHGSAEHLLTGRTATPATPPASIASNGALFERIAADPASAGHLRMIASTLNHAEQRALTGPTLDAPTEHDEREDQFQAVVNEIVASVEVQVSPATVTWMSGVARVTAVCPAGDGEPDRLVVASPLYLEYIDPPI